jgi:8-oxo-dGTP diphosphatase
MLPWLLRVWRQLPSPLRVLYLRMRYGFFAVGVAALIRNKNGQVLLVHRTYSREEPWAMPGGWLERHDESIESALTRELREETGLGVRVGKVGAVERTGFALVVLMHAELLDSPSKFRRSPEVSEVAWAEPAQVSQLSQFNARLLRQALE